MDGFHKNVRIGPLEVSIDYVHGDDGYEFKRGIRERSRLRGFLMDLADSVTISSLSSGTLVLIEPELSSETIKEVWAGAERVCRPEVLDRLGLIEAQFDKFDNLELKSYSRDISESERERIQLMIRAEDKKSKRSRKAAPGNSAHEVLRVLITRWLDVGNPAITLAQLGEETGYTYKPIRQALNGLSKHIVRFGNRGVLLKSFPRDAWARLFMDRESIRETILYWPEGEMPRSPAVLLKRFRQLPDEIVDHVGIGGVDGAHYYAHDLDMIGLPRLDLTVHCPNGKADLEFIKKLDPDLARVDDPKGPCSLVIHLLRRPRAYFKDGFADPAECLLDLQEMRLEKQAREFLRSFQAAKDEDF